MQGFTDLSSVGSGAELHVAGRRTEEIRRGDRMRVTQGCGMASHLVYVWRVDGTTVTLATGWRLWYLRLLHNPVRDAVRLFAYVWEMIFWRPLHGENR